jgi:phosphatidylserine/phosphatidylglycerophosphate/cardiolipin synthase-like enzyme
LLSHRDETGLRSRKVARLRLVDRLDHRAIAAMEAPLDHSKLLTIDGVWSLIGSANWDVRSFRLNFELSVEL